MIPQDYLNPLIQFQQSNGDSSSSGNCGQAETKDVEGSSLQEAPLGCSQEEEETPAVNNQCHTGSRTNEENVLTDADLISGYKTKHLFLFQNQIRQRNDRSFEIVIAFGEMTFVSVSVIDVAPPTTTLLAY